MGPSGSGKSTLMHCMAGLDVPTSGQAFVGDQEIGRLDDGGLTQTAARAHRLRLPVVQPGPDADRGGEHHAAADLAGRIVDRAWFDYLVGALGIADRLDTPAERALRRASSSASPARER